MDCALFDPRLRGRAQLRILDADRHSHPSRSHQDPIRSHPHPSGSAILTSTASPSTFGPRSAVRRARLAGLASGARPRLQLQGADEGDECAVPGPELLDRLRLQRYRSVHLPLRAPEQLLGHFIRLRSRFVSTGCRLRKRSLLLALSRSMRRPRHRARVPRRTRRVHRRRGLLRRRPMHGDGGTLDVHWSRMRPRRQRADHQLTRGKRLRCCCRRDRARTPRSSPSGIPFWDHEAQAAHCRFRRR